MATALALGDDQNLKRFESEVGTLIRWHDAKGPELAKDRNAMFAHNDEFVKKLKAVGVEGIPEDLRSAFQEFATALGDFNSVAAKGPGGAAAEATMARDNPAQFAAFQTIFELAQEAYGKRVQKLQEALLKYKLQFARP
jgi:hypothetical protein